MIVKSWPLSLATRASIPYALLALSMILLVSCATVAGDPDAAESPAASPRDSATVMAGASAADTAPVPLARGVPAPSLTEPPAPATGVPVSAVEPLVAAVELPAPASTPSTAAPAATQVPTSLPLEALPGGAPVGTAGASAAPVDAPATPADAPATPATELAGAATTTLVGDGSALDERTRRKLDAILRNTVKNRGVAGLQAAVRLPSGEIWLGSAGKAEMVPARPIVDDTQFAIASVTKTFVAALILQLADEGKVELDAPFGTYFQDAPRSKKVTLRQLLSHTSGIYNFWQHPRYSAITQAWWETPDATGQKARDHEWTYEEMMDLVKGGYFKPGKGFAYSNTNYLILRRVAEAVEGKPIHKQLRQRFFEPLGMEHTVYQPAETPDAGAAHGHWNYGTGYTDHTRESTVVPFMAAVTVADAAGAMASTARDLAIWAAALYGGEVLSADSLAQMTTFLRPGFYGLGTDVALFAGHRGHGHRGGIRGYDSSMWYFPSSGVSVVLLSNRGNWMDDKPMTKLVKAVLGPG
jgi:D-alanyl-D-alanine carboxypeptidase